MLFLHYLAKPFARKEDKEMTTPTICTAAAALLYLAAGLGIVRGMKSESGSASPMWRWPVLLGLVLHGFGIHAEIFQPDSVRFGFSLALSVMFFFAAAIMFVESYVHRMHGQFGIVLTAAAFAAILPVVFPGVPSQAAQWSTLFRVHLLLALASYSFMVIAVVHAVIMTLQNRRLKTMDVADGRPGFLETMPGLVVMERIFFRIVAVGFVFLTLVLVTGGLATKEALGVYFNFDHKMILTWISWAVFGILLLGRATSGWRARKALAWFWIGFALQIVAYVGYSFIKEVF